MEFSFPPAALRRPRRGLEATLNILRCNGRNCQSETYVIVTLLKRRGDLYLIL